MTEVQVEPQSPPSTPGGPEFGASKTLIVKGIESRETMTEETEIKSLEYIKRRSDSEFVEQILLDSSHSTLGEGIENISDLSSQPRPCCGFQDVDTVLEFVFGVRHYQEELDNFEVKGKGKVDALAT